MDLNLFWNFVSAFDQAYDCHRQCVMKKFSLTSAEVDTLLFVANNPTLNTAADIVRLRKIAKSHVSLAVKSLREKGYLTQCPDSKNCKRMRLFITERADEIVRVGRLEQQQFVNLLERSLSEEDKIIWKNHLLQLTNRLETHIQEKNLLKGSTKL